jgi:hypothetical protein
VQRQSDDDITIGSGLHHDDDRIRAVQPLATAGGAPPSPVAVPPGKKTKKKKKTIKKQLANLFSGGQVNKAEAKVERLEQVGLAPSHP